MRVPLTLATFNIRNGLAWDGMRSWPFRRSAVATVLDDLAADVVGLQEVYRFQRRYLRKQVPRFRDIGQGRASYGGGELCPVLVGPRVTAYSDQTCWYGDAPHVAGCRLPGASFPRIATIVRGRTRDGSSARGLDFVLANTHLDERVPANRERSAAQLLGWLDGTAPTVVMGDLNATPNAKRLVRLFVDAGFVPVEVEGGTAHKWRGGLDCNRIDYIWLRDGDTATWSIGAAEVVTTMPGGRLPSDHWPLRAEVVLTAR